MKKYISLNEEKEKAFNNDVNNMLGRKTKFTKSIIQGSVVLNEVDTTQVNILINKLTKKIGNSLIQSDIIQNALEYNNYLINELEKNKHKISVVEYNNAVIILWENLKKLSHNADDFTSKFNLNDNKKYNELYSWYKERYIPTGLTVIIDKSILVKEEEEVDKIEDIIKIKQDNAELKEYNSEMKEHIVELKRELEKYQSKEENNLEIVIESVKVEDIIQKQEC
jgi:hypothetical protein